MLARLQSLHRDMCHSEKVKKSFLFIWFSYLLLSSGQMRDLFAAIQLVMSPENYSKDSDLSSVFPFISVYKDLSFIFLTMTYNTIGSLSTK